jgi:hypothetical protein
MRFTCLFHLDVVYVAILYILQAYVSNILAISYVRYKCFIWMLHMLQWLYTYVASVCFSCFKRMLQAFYLDVAYVALAIHVCCKCMFQMFQLFQTYVASVLSGCCICCSGHTHMLQAYVYKCFICFGRMLQQMLYGLSVA